MLKVSLVQAKIKWHDPEHNLIHYDQLVSTIAEADLIVLPEMWVSGFTMMAHRYYESQGPALDLMKKWSQEKQATIIGSLITKIGESYYNRMYVVSEGALLHTYDKKHLFAFAGEDRIFKAGTDHLLCDIEGWKLNVQICYDLRFPVWARNTQAYDLLIYSANWPNQRIEAWQTLLKARAIENQSYVVGVNCFGKDVWENSYAGHSAAISYDGSMISTIADKEGVVDVLLDKEALVNFRNKLPFLKDQDLFKFQ